MIWYLAKVFVRAEDYSDPNDANWVQALTCPGVGDPITQWQGGVKSRVHAYDLDNLTCLVGTFKPINLPEGWTLLTLVEAQVEFTTAVGRAPTSKEIC